jgi:hypothetical protein
MGNKLGTLPSKKTFPIIYGTEGGKQFEVDQNVELEDDVRNSGDVYKVIKFNRDIGYFINGNGKPMPETDTELMKKWLCVERISSTKGNELGTQLCDLIDSFKLSSKLPLTGGKRKSRRRTHKRSKKARKSRSRYHH